MESKDNPNNIIFRKYLQKSSDNVLIIRESYRLQRFKNILQKYNVALKSIKSKGKSEKNDLYDSKEVKDNKDMSLSKNIENKNFKPRNFEEELKNDIELNNLVANQIKGFESSTTNRNILKFEEQVSLTNTSKRNKKDSKLKMNTDNNRIEDIENEKEKKKPNFYNSINKKVKVKIKSNLHKHQIKEHSIDNNYSKKIKLIEESKIDGNKDKSKENNYYRIKSSFKTTNIKNSYNEEKSPDLKDSIKYEKENNNSNFYDNKLNNSNSLIIGQETSIKTLKDINKENLRKIFPAPLKDIKPKVICLGYIVDRNNNGKLVSNYLSNYENWRELENQQTTFFDFKWSETSSGINYSKLGEFSSSKQLVNHFENHHHISNKMHLFNNMMVYCEVSFILYRQII